VTVVELVTACVVTAKFALEAPAGIVTLAGTVATDGVPLERAMTAPPVGASPFSPTLPVDGVPPFTLVGLSVKVVRIELAACPVMASEAVSVTPE
jgi:hypothetical protein